MERIVITFFCKRKYFIVIMLLQQNGYEQHNDLKALPLRWERVSLLSSGVQGYHYDLIS